LTIDTYIQAPGRFLQTDPIPGGSANNYDYCAADPINCTDLNGLFVVPDGGFGWHSHWGNWTPPRKSGGCSWICVARHWPTNAAGRVMGWVQGHSHKCGSGETRCVYNARFVPGGADAWTFGNTIYCRHQCQGLVAHELVHVGQFQRGGIVFPFQYAWEWIWGGSGCGNKYERAAYNRAGPHPC
jgi:hypothetical protein